MATARILDTGLYQLQTGQFHIEAIQIFRIESWNLHLLTLDDVDDGVFPGDNFDLRSAVWPLAAGWGYLQLRGSL